MKPLVLLAAVALVGCDGDCDTADASCKSGAAPPAIVNYHADCDDETTCFWAVEADASMGPVELVIVATGDPAFVCGPDKTINPCGVWEETHTSFSLADCASERCIESKQAALAVVLSEAEQVDNQSTVFFSHADFETITYLFKITDPAGDLADCVAAGHMPSYFDSECN